MATNRILEFTPSHEEAVVARILVLLHRAVDDHFPAAEKANRQFTKTVFSDDRERTGIGPAPHESTAPLHSFGSEEQTGPGERPPEPQASLPPHELPTDAASQARSAKPMQLPAAPATPTAPPSKTSAPATGLSGMSGIMGIGEKPRDWLTIMTLVLLVAGLVLLAYSFLA